MCFYLLPPVPDENRHKYVRNGVAGSNPAYTAWLVHVVKTYPKPPINYLIKNVYISQHVYVSLNGFFLFVPGESYLHYEEVLQKVG